MSIFQTGLFFRQESAGGSDQGVDGSRKESWRLEEIGLCCCGHKFCKGCAKEGVVLGSKPKCIFFRLGILKK